MAKACRSGPRKQVMLFIIDGSLRGKIKNGWADLPVVKTGHFLTSIIETTFRITYTNYLLYYPKSLSCLPTDMM
jgi:hypothetical protein